MSKSGLISVLAILVITPVVSGDYRITWSTIDSGGGTCRGGQYVLTGTIGQPDAAYSSGGNYELLGGFWPGGPFCIVDFEDFSLFSESWLKTGSDIAADFDGNGIVDLYDLVYFIDGWMCLCPYNWSLK